MNVKNKDKISIKDFTLKVKALQSKHMYNIPYTDDETSDYGTYSIFPLCKALLFSIRCKLHKTMQMISLNLIIFSKYFYLLPMMVVEKVEKLQGTGKGLSMIN